MRIKPICLLALCLLTPALSGAADKAPARKPSPAAERVEIVTRHEKIAYRTIIRPSTKGFKPHYPTISSPGRDGRKKVTYRVTYRGGKVVSKVFVSKVILKDAIPQIVTAGRYIKTSYRGAYAGRRVFTMETSAYSPDARSCGKYANGRTATGKRAGYGIAAVDPRVIPMGTKLYIEGYGYAIAADVGGAIKGNRIDLGFNSHKGAIKWGRRKVRVVIID